MASAKVSERVEASAERVWGLLGDFGGIDRFSDAIEKCTVEGEGVGARRTLSMGAISLVERLEAFDGPGRRLQYSIVEGPLPMENYLATIEVREDGTDACTVDWSGSFDPKGISDEQAVAMVEGIYKGGIKGVKKTLGV